MTTTIDRDIVAARVPECSAGAGADTIRELLAEHGAVVVKAASPPEEIRAALFELEPYIRRTPKGEGRFYGFQTRRCNALVRKSHACVDLALNPVVLQVMEETLAPWCDQIQLSTSQAIRIEPGEAAQFLHRDDEIFPIIAHLATPVEFMINAIWAASPFTEANGATRIVPGSHRWDRSREPAEHEIAASIMEPGDVVLFLGSVIHGGGANTSRSARTGLTFSYSVGWVRQMELMPLSTPWEVAQHLPERLQRLLGYQVHRPSLGYVEGIDPIDWLKAGQPAVSAARDMFTPAQLEMVNAGVRAAALAEA